jgi:dTDP-4-dehydrorhamnose reductase
MTIFLTGASGLLGNALATAFTKSGWTVHAVHNKRKPTQPGLHLHKIDLTDSKELRHLLNCSKPDSIVNAAALSVPAKCQEDPLLSKALNVALPVELAQVAADQELRFITFSTDLVFDGKLGNYHPSSPTNPTNLYGEHKRESEIRVEETYEKTCIIRLPLLMGNSPSGTRSTVEGKVQETGYSII